ncbi:sensor histidine kinase [bacterium SCSIO 12741]|nr:sensor histidine kinase [bacterium SCSIO 12741]
MRGSSIWVGIVLCLWLAAPGSVYADSAEADSLLQIYHQSTQDQEKAELAVAYGKLMVRTDQVAVRSLCIPLLNELEELNSEVSYDLRMTIGISYKYSGYIDSSSYYFSQALIHARHIPDSAKVMKTYRYLAANYRNGGRYEESVRSSLKALAYYTVQQDSLEMIKVMNDLGNVYYLMNSFDEGDRYQHRALSAMEGIEDPRTLGNIYTSLAYGLERNERFDSALFYNQKAIDLFQKEELIYNEAIARRNRCAIYTRMGSSEEDLIDCYRNSLEVDEAIGDWEGVMINRFNLGTSLNETGDYAEARNQVEQALSLAREMGDQRLKFMSYYTLSDIYSRQKNFTQAYHYLDSSYQLQEEVRGEEVQSTILELDKKYQISEKEKELYKTKKEKAEAELKVSEKNNLIGIIAGAGGFLILGLGFVFYRNKQQEKSKLAAARIEEQQKGLEAVIEAQEQERSRIARDLHDGMVQQLAGLKLGFGRLFGDTPHQDSGKLMDLLDQSTQELRELSHTMMPRSLAESGLVPALEDMLELSLKNRIEYSFEHFNVPNRYAENLEITLFRVAQELVNNLLKHSQASLVQVQLFQAGSQIHLSVEDNGVGFDSDANSDGIGLRNITSRLETVQGKLMVESTPNKGTRMAVTIPMG